MSNTHYRRRARQIRDNWHFPARLDADTLSAEGHVSMEIARLRPALRGSTLQVPCKMQFLRLKEADQLDDLFVHDVGDVGDVVDGSA